MTTKTIAIGSAVVAVLAGGIYVATRTTTPTTPVASFPTYPPAPTRLPLPPGYWRQGNIDVPCNATVPYIKWVNPQDGKTVYLRADASALVVTTDVDGAPNSIFDCADHCSMGWLDGMLIPYRGGLGGVIYPAPWRDSANGNICRDYTAATGKPCPSGVPLGTYSAQIMGTYTWQTGLAAYAEARKVCNGPQPTWTPTGIVPMVTKTPVPIPTVPGACPTCPPSNVVCVTVTPKVAGLRMREAPKYSATLPAFKSACKDDHTKKKQCWKLNSGTFLNGDLTQIKCPEPGTPVLPCPMQFEEDGTSVYFDPGPWPTIRSTGGFTVAEPQ